MSEAMIQSLIRGLVPKPVGGPDPWFVNGQPDIKNWFGADATDYFFPGKFVSGNITTEVLGYTLAAAGTPAYREPLTGAANDPLGVGFSNDSDDSFNAANGTIYDIDGLTTSGAFLITAWNDRDRNADRQYAGKLDRASGDFENSVGWAFGNDYKRRCALWVNAETRLQQENWCQEVGPAYALVYFDHVAGKYGYHTKAGYVQANIPVAGISATGATGYYNIGSWAYPYLRARESVLGPQVIWIGAAADIVIAGAATNVAAWAAAVGSF